MFVTRIADPYVDTIETWKAVGQPVKQGQRIGLIRMGSQTDLPLPARWGGKKLDILVREGQYVKGASAATAELK